MLTVPLPWTVTGDTVYLGAGGVPTSLAIGASGTVYIGGTIPAWSATPTLTGLTLTEAIGSSALTLTGATQTASFPVINATQTWNNAGVTFNLLNYTVTSTASAAASSFLNYTLASTNTRVNISKLGTITLTSASSTGNVLTIGNTDNHTITNSSNSGGVSYQLIGDTTGGGGAASFRLGSTGTIEWNSAANLASGAIDLVVARDAADTFAQRRTTNAQTYRLYNTFTDASNYERATLNWASNILHLGTANAGTGTARVLQLDYGGTTTAALSVPITSGAIIVGGGIQLAGAVIQVNGIATSGLYGVPAIVATGRSTAQTGAVASLSTYTLPAVDGSFEVSGNVLVTASTTHSITMTVAYTDESNTARTLTLNFSQVTGTLLTAITNVQGVGAYEGVPLHIRCKASTSITFATTGTFTSITYNAEGIIKQTA